MNILGDDVTATFVSTALPSTPGQGLSGVNPDESYVPGVSTETDK